MRTEVTCRATEVEIDGFYVFTRVCTTVRVLPHYLLFSVSKILIYSSVAVYYVLVY